jgi:hypothetical protein
MVEAGVRVVAAAGVAAEARGLHPAEEAVVAAAEVHVPRPVVVAVAVVAVRPRARVPTMAVRLARPPLRQPPRARSRCRPPATADRATRRPAGPRPILRAGTTPPFASRRAPAGQMIAVAGTAPADAMTRAGRSRPRLHVSMTPRDDRQMQRVRRTPRPATTGVRDLEADGARWIWGPSAPAVGPRSPRSRVRRMACVRFPGPAPASTRACPSAPNR